MLQALIFDFDGVITDSEVLHLRSFNQVLSQYGIRIETKVYYRDYLGLTDVDLFRVMIEKGLLKVDSTKIEILLKQKKQAFEKLAKTEGRIIEGVRDFLQMLSQNSIKTAICSGALLVEIELILQEANLRSFFEVIVAADHVRKGKPNPEGFLLTLRKLNEKSQTQISAGHCVVVEDSHWGLEAAIAAKMHTIAVTNSYDADQLTQAEKIVPQLDQLTITDLQQLCS